MNFNAQNFKSYKASKIASKTHNSIHEMLDTRIKLETLVPTITMLDKDYSRRVYVDCEAYYTQSGFEYLQADKIDVERQRLSLKVDLPKLNALLDSDDADEFTTLEQALSILALGTPEEILKSETFIESTLHHNKHVKRKEMMAGIDTTKTQVTELTGKFKSFDEKVRAVIASAHTYMKSNRTL